MKNTFILLVLFITLTSSQCRKESSKCHKSLTFINQSGSSVYFATGYNKGKTCYFSGHLCHKGESFVDKVGGWCFEDGYRNTEYVLYVIDTSQINNGGTERYPCDSVDYYNKVLRVYSLDVQEMKDNNFIITYR